MNRQLNIGFIQAKNKFDVHFHRPLAYGYLKSYLGKKTDIPFKIKYWCVSVDNGLGHRQDLPA